MLLSFIVFNANAHEETEDHWQAYLQRSIDYVNKNFDTKLTINYTLYAHKTTPRSCKLVNVDESIVCFDRHDSMVCISDEEADDDNDEDNLMEFISFDVSKILTKKITLKILDESGIGRIDYKSGFEQRFKPTNFNLDCLLDSFPSCPLCCNSFQRDTLLTHLETCGLFIISIDD